MCFNDYLQDKEKSKMIEILTKKYYKMFYKVQYGYEYEDVLQEVYLRLSKCFDKWNCGEYKINTFIDKTIKSVISNLIDKLNSEKNQLLNKGNYYSLDYTLDDETKLNTFNTVVGIKDIEHCNEYSLDTELLFNLINNMKNENYKRVLTLRAKGYTPKEISIIEGKTQQCINTTLANAIKNLRKVNNINV